AASTAARCCEPLSVAVAYIPSDDPAGNDVKARWVGLRKADEDVEEVLSEVGFGLLVHDPGRSDPLARLHLDADALGRVPVGRQDVDSSRVSQGQGRDVSATRQFSGDEVLAGDSR